MCACETTIFIGYILLMHYLDTLGRSYNFHSHFEMLIQFHITTVGTTVTELLFVLWAVFAEKVLVLVCCQLKFIMWPVVSPDPRLDIPLPGLLD